MIVGVGRDVGRCIRRSKQKDEMLAVKFWEAFLELTVDELLTERRGQAGITSELVPAHHLLASPQHGIKRTVNLQ